jgi:hypothetical protein
VRLRCDTTTEDCNSKQRLFNQGEKFFPQRLGARVTSEPAALIRVVEASVEQVKRRHFDHLLGQQLALDQKNFRTTALTTLSPFPLRPLMR